MNTKELIEQAIALPVEERALMMDALLRSLNPPQSEIDAQWAAEAKRRLAELRAGTVEAVFERVWERLVEACASCGETRTPGSEGSAWLWGLPLPDYLEQTLVLESSPPKTRQEDCFGFPSRSSWFEKDP